MTIRSFAEARAILSRHQPIKTKPQDVYKLDRMRSLMAYLGNPQNELRIIHVAGTSGKTSTAYYCAALLSAGGQKVGLTVSPHVMEVNERVQINLVPLSETTFCSELGTFLDHVAAAGLKPTYFEIMIAFAFWEFHKLHVDYAVIEVGLGGLLDGTNVIDRSDKVAIITDIGIDHIGVLGSTLPEIAAQKAGIIGLHNQVFCNHQGPSVMRVIRRESKAQGATLHELTAPMPLPADVRLPAFQQRNFGLARAAVDFIEERDSLPSLLTKQIVQAARTLIPGRMEVFQLGRKTVIVDGAHNAQKLQAFVDAVHEAYPNQPVAAVVGFVSGSEFRLQTALKVLADLTQHLIITNFADDQDLPKLAVDPQVLAQKSRQAGIKDVATTDTLNAAIELLLQRPESILVITGSFYLLKSIRLRMLRE